MHYGHGIHTPRPDDRTIIYCRCGWRSQELTHSQVTDLGLPWWCDRCNSGGSSLYWVTFHPEERAKALEIIDPPKYEHREISGGFSTDQFTVKSIERILFGFTDPRAPFGTKGND